MKEKNHKQKVKEQDKLDKVLDEISKWKKISYISFSISAILFIFILFELSGSFISYDNMYEEMQENMQDDNMMQEHCQMMPNMQGCKTYLNKDKTTHHNSQMGDGMMSETKNLASTYSTNTKNLPEAKKTQVLNLKDNDRVNLSIDIIKKTIAGQEVRMFGYNGQIPGPLIHVKQNSTIYVNVTNNLDVETTVHWHGLRLDNKFDGVPGLTMKTQKPGNSFEYKLDFKDEGIYWYHPHVREDYQQELGLYGNMLVDSIYKDYYNPVNKEKAIILDDILIENGQIAPFFDGVVTHSLMGRFGNIMLINGDDEFKYEVNKGDVVRFYITNVANTRTFNFTIPGVKIKLVGGDIGSYEKETYVDSIIIAPAERYTIEAYFENEGIYKMKNINPQNTYILGEIKVSNSTSNQSYVSDFLSLRENKYVKEDIAKFKKYFDKKVDSTIELSVTMAGMGRMSNSQMMGGDFDGDTIEWEDNMAMMNKRSNNNTMEWILVDKETGKENMNIKYKYKVGDKIKIRLYNDPNSMHPMQHPIHFHGQRFLVLEKDGKRNENLVWKDTVLVPVGSYVDILLDVTNPGEWMAHCHIAEHLQSGMMMTFKVEA